MNKLVHRLSTSLLLVFSLAFPDIAQTLYAETDTPLPTQEAAD